MTNYVDLGGCYSPRRKAEDGSRGTRSERGKARIREFKKDGSKRHFAIEKWLKGEAKSTVDGKYGRREFWIHRRCRVSATQGSKTQITPGVPKLPYSDLGGWLLLERCD